VKIIFSKSEKEQRRCQEGWTWSCIALIEKYGVYIGVGVSENDWCVTWVYRSGSI